MSTVPDEIQKLLVEYICRPDSGKEGKPYGFKKGWGRTTAKQNLSPDYHIAAVYDLSQSDYAVIDIDTDDYDVDEMFATLGLSSTYCRGNSKGFHVWVKFLPDEKPKDKNIIDCMSVCTGDLLCGHVWEKVDKEWSEDTIATISMADIDDILISSKFMAADPNPETEVEPRETSELTLIASLVKIIDDKYVNDRDIRIKILWAMKKCGFEEADVEAWYMWRLGATQEGFTAAWETYKDPDQIKCTEGTIRYYAKMSNPTEYARLTIPDFLKANATESDYATLFQLLEGDCCIVENGEFYLYFKNAWRKIDTKSPAVLRFFVSSTLKTYFIALRKRLTNQLNDENKEEIEEKIKRVMTYLNMMGKITWISNITRCVLDFNISKHIDSEDIFDKKPDIIVFKNTAFNLATREKYEVKKEDYISQTTGKDYMPPTKAALATIHTLMCSIFPVEEERKCYLSLLYLSLTGHNPEKFVIANGGGRNGKGLLNELMFELLGNYAYKLSVDILTKETKRTGANPELANLHKKRMVVATEPEDGVKLQMGIVKELTGGAEISARGLYQANTKVSLNMTLFLECNKKPQLNSRIDNSIIERLIEVPFRASFMSSEEDVDKANLRFMANPEYKTQKFRDEHYSALFKYILDNAEPKLYVPECIRTLTKEYAMNSDEWYVWFNELFEVSADPNAYVLTKDIYDDYKQSDYYSMLNKAARRQQTKKWFDAMITNHVVLRRNYKGDRPTINGVRIQTPLIIGYVRKDDEGEEN